MSFTFLTEGVKQPILCLGKRGSFGVGVGVAAGLGAAVTVGDDGATGLGLLAAVPPMERCHHVPLNPAGS